MEKTPLWKVNDEFLMKDEIEDVSDFGVPPNKRSIDQLLRFGIINLDKPPNPSSQEVVSWVKKILNVKHAGHGGTLEAKYAGKIPL
jgi:H/ACA ribonucleoprotein complex subunit 4